MSDFAGPFAGAAVGFFLGGPEGAAVGWLVGSWLFGPRQQQNEIIDPGAEEAPRFNQALRGVTMNVMFGTNRISSHVIWQNNFQAIRVETLPTGAAGGKGGGSAGGKIPGPAPEISYNYKWDLIYHLGIPCSPFSLYGGWLGSERIEDSVIISISSSLPVSQLFQDPTQDPDKVFLEFTESFFYPGVGADTPGQSIFTGWSHFDTVVGSTIRLPHSVWIGFKELGLGQNPHIPQLSWEVGPGEQEIIFNSNYICSAAIGGTAINGIDNLGQMYFFISTGGKCIDRDCNLVWDLTTSEIKTLFLAKDSDIGGTVASFCFPIVNGTKLLFILDAVNIAGTEKFLWMGVSPISTSGDPTLLTGALRMSLGIQPFNATRVMDVGQGGNDESVIIQGRDFTTSDTQWLLTPSISDIENSVSGYLGGSHAWKTLEVPKLYFEASTEDEQFLWDFPALDQAFGEYNLFGNVTGFSLPYLIIDPLSSDIIYGTNLYFYINKQIMDQHDLAGGNENPEIRDTIQPAHPNGAIVKFQLGLVKHAGHLIGSARSFIISSPTYSIENSNWINLTTLVPEIPFDNEGTILSTGAIGNNFSYESLAAVEKLDDGNYLVLFSGAAENSVDGANSTQLTAAVRAFVYNSFDQKGYQFANQFGVVTTISDDPSYNTAGQSIDIGHLYPHVIDDELYLWILNGGNRSLLTKFGDIIVSGGSDVTPPFIIREILTNNVFGIAFDESLINESFYETAVLYCEANGFLVSTQYTREVNVLDIIEELLSIYGGFLVFSNGLLKFGLLEFQLSSVRTIDNDHLKVDRNSGKPPVTIIKGALQDTMNKVKVNYIDRDIDYKQNQIEEADEVDQDLTGVRVKEFPPQFVMSEQTARTMAMRGLLANLYTRDTYKFKLGWKDADLEPGDVITLVDSHYPPIQNGQTVRIVQVKEPERGLFDVIAKQEAQHIFAASGTVLDITSASVNEILKKAPAPLNNVAYELPCEFQPADQGQVYLNWVADGFAAGANLYVSADNVSFAPTQRVSPFPITGKLFTDLANVSPGAFNENIEVLLMPSSSWTINTPVYDTDLTLNEVSPENRARKVSLLWIGSEMLAYEGVNLVAQNHYRFDRIHRGWGGTHIHAHNSGDFFYKHGGGIFSQEFTEDQIGTILYYKVVPFNLSGIEFDVASIDPDNYTIQGAHFKPQVPPTPRYIQNSIDYRGQTLINVGSEGNIALDWRDSARKSGFGAQGYGSTIQGYGQFISDTISHSWLVSVIGSGDTVVRTTSVNTANYIYANSDNFNDNGAWRGNVAISIIAQNDFGQSPRTEVISLELFI